MNCINHWPEIDYLLFGGTTGYITISVMTVSIAISLLYLYMYTILDLFFNFLVFTISTVTSSASYVTIFSSQLSRVKIGIHIMLCIINMLYKFLTRSKSTSIS